PLRSAGSSGSFRTWNTTSAQLVATATVGKGPVGWAAWSPDGKLVVAAPANVAIVAESAPPFREIARCTGHTAAVSYVAFDATGEHVVTASEDGTARMCDAQTGREIQVFRGESKSGLAAAAVSPDGTLLATGGLDRT